MKKKRVLWSVSCFDKGKIFIIWSNFIEHLFSTSKTGMLDHPSLIFFKINSRWLHQLCTFGISITRKYIIEVFRVQTMGAMISCTSFRMLLYFFFTIFALKTFVEHFKSHIFITWLCKLFCTMKDIIFITFLWKKDFFLHFYIFFFLYWLKRLLS